MIRCATIYPVLRRSCLAGLLTLCAALLPFAAFGQAATKVTGSFGATFFPDDGSIQGFFSCTGLPTCIGTYTVQLRDSSCPNTFTLSDTITVTGLSLAQPGAIRGVLTLTNVNFHDGRNADGTCFIKPELRSDRSLPFTGTWNGSTGAFTMATTRDNGQPLLINGTFTADIPAAKPVFPMVVTGSIDFAQANIAAAIQFRPQDVGTAISVYVFALAPTTKVVNAATAKEGHLGLLAKGSPKDAPVQCVLAQLNPSGQLHAVSASNLQAATTNTLSSQGAAVTVLNNVSTPQIAGATFFVGYGPNATAMINNGVNRSAVSVPGSQACLPSPPQAGWWWNPAESGRGYSLEVQGNNIFFASYLYDASGRSTWYAAMGPTSLDGSLFNGRLLGFAHGQTLTGAYHGPDAAVDSGAITLAFNDASHGAMIWPGGSVPIERFSIVTNGLTAAPLANQPESGWWWSEQESGRGFFLEWQASSAFVAGYMYDTSGNPLWYASFPTTPDPVVLQGSWTQFADGQTLSGLYKPASQVNGNVGALGIQFQNSTSATMTLPDGRQIPLTRFRF